jgi:hypothetical protein
MAGVPSINELVLSEVGGGQVHRHGRGTTEGF